MLFSELSTNCLEWLRAGFYTYTRFRSLSTSSQRHANNSVSLFKVEVKACSATPRRSSQCVKKSPVRGKAPRGNMVQKLTTLIHSSCFISTTRRGALTGFNRPSTMFLMSRCSTCIRLNLGEQSTVEAKLHAIKNGSVGSRLSTSKYL